MFAAPSALQSALHMKAPTPALGERDSADDDAEPVAPYWAGWHLSSYELQSGVTVIEVEWPELECLA